MRGHIRHRRFEHGVLRRPQIHRRIGRAARSSNSRLSHSGTPGNRSRHATSRRCRFCITGGPHRFHGGYGWIVVTPGLNRGHGAAAYSPLLPHVQARDSHAPVGQCVYPTSNSIEQLWLFKRQFSSAQFSFDRGCKRPCVLHHNGFGLGRDNCPREAQADSGPDLKPVKRSSTRNSAERFNVSFFKKAPGCHALVNGGPGPVLTGFRVK